MTAKVFSCAISGLSCNTIEVEADISQGLPCFTIVGLGGTSIQESRERVRASIKNSGADFPHTKKIINLAPAQLRKEGSHFDLAIAASILLKSGQIPAQEITNSIIVGELSLNGQIKSISGALPIAQHAKEKGFDKIFLPADNAEEASFIEGIEIYPLETLRQFISFSNGLVKITQQPHSSLERIHRPIVDGFPNIIGLEKAKRALTVAAIGGHSVLMSGPPGAGKTLLARAFKNLLPPMSKQEILETTKIYSISGLTQKNSPIIKQRPFREVHHTASTISIIGGGNLAKPGEITLAHNGVLFLDEIAEFPKKTLETLRQPLEDKYINITRANYSNKYPSNFILIATTNPCPCGYFSHPKKRCTCRPHEIQNYRKKLSGPILDRIDIHLEIPHIPIKDINDPSEESPIKIQNIAKTTKNADLKLPQIRKICPLTEDAKNFLSHSAIKLQLSNRSHLKTIRIARSIADLEHSTIIQKEHIAESLHYRRMQTNTI